MKFGMNLLLWTGDLSEAAADLGDAQGNGLRRRRTADVRPECREVCPLGETTGRPGSASVPP